jgi:hypothetical protein
MVNYDADARRKLAGRQSARWSRQSPSYGPPSPSKQILLPHAHARPCPLALARILATRHRKQLRKVRPPRRAALAQANGAAFEEDVRLPSLLSSCVL